MDDAEELAKLKSERELFLGLAGARITPEGSKILPEYFADRIKAGVIVQKDGQTPMSGSGPDGAATIDDLVKEAVERFPMMFFGDGRGGGGASQRGPRHANTITRAEFDALPGSEKWAKVNSGIKVVD